MVFEAHGMPFSCTELLLLNYAMVKTVFHSMAPLTEYSYMCSVHVVLCLNIKQHTIRHKIFGFLQCIVLYIYIYIYI